MSQYANKVIELFKKTRGAESTVQDFHEWLTNEEQVEEKEASLQHLWNEPNDISRGEILKSLGLFKKRNFGKFSTNRIILWRYAAAIVALICITTAYIFTSNPSSEVNFIEHYSSIGDINIIELPDGSVVKTNSSSVLVYPDNFGKKNRTIYLTGEANFQVARNEKIPFIVKSKDFAVTALGTEFNVSSYPDDQFYKTTLIQGSIRIENQNKGIEQIMNVDEQFSFNKETAEYTVETTNVEDVTAWQRGELVFREATVAEIVKVLERKYKVVFHNNSNNTDIYNFRFQKNASLEKVLDVMKNVVDNFSYKLVDDICYIY